MTVTRQLGAGPFAIALVPGPRRLAPFVGLARVTSLARSSPTSPEKLFAGLYAGRDIDSRRSWPARSRHAACPFRGCDWSARGCRCRRWRECCASSASRPAPSRRGNWKGSPHRRAPPARAPTGVERLRCLRHWCRRCRYAGKVKADDLPGIGRIGEDLLIAGHGGIEADLADRRFRSAPKPCAFEQGAVGQHQRRRERMPPRYVRRWASGASVMGMPWICAENRDARPCRVNLRDSYIRLTFQRVGLIGPDLR